MVNVPFTVGGVNTTPNNQRNGYTLLEMVVVIGVLLVLVAITIIGAQVYVNGTRETACIINQSTIHTAIVSQANLNEEDLVPGVDYFSGLEFQEIFGDIPECPAVGGYTAFVDPDTGRLVITCVEHGHGSSE